VIKQIAPHFAVSIAEKRDSTQEKRNGLAKTQSVIEKIQLLELSGGKKVFFGTELTQGSCPTESGEDDARRQAKRHRLVTGRRRYNALDNLPLMY